MKKEPVSAKVKYWLII